MYRGRVCIEGEGVWRGRMYRGRGCIEGEDV